MPRVTFGNTHPISKVEHPDGDGRQVTVHHDHIARTDSMIDLPAHWVPDASPQDLDSWSRDESFRSIPPPGGRWAMRSPDKPAWVEAPDWPELEAVLRQWYGVAGRPDDWQISIGETPALRVDLPATPPAV